MRSARWFAIGILMLPLACASPPERPPLDRATIRSIESGVTTQAQIEAWFGTPSDMQVRPSGSLWRYERRFRELERPGPVRSAVCGSLGSLPVIQLPFYWFRTCTEIERREKLELRFSQEHIVTALVFDEDVDPQLRGYREPVGYPVPGYPVPIPIPRVRSDGAAADAAGSSDGQRR